MVEIPVETAVSRLRVEAHRGTHRLSDRAASSRCSSRRAVTIRRRGDGAADPRPARAGRQLVALLAPHLQHRAQRIQTEVLRLGAGLRVAGDAPAAAVRRAVRVLHRRSRTSTRQKGRRGTTTARSCSARSCCSRFFAEATPGAVRSVVDRENLVRKIQFPRLVIPAVGRAAGVVQPRSEPDRRDGLRPDRGRTPDAQLARAAADRRDARWCSPPGVAMLLSALFVRFRDIQPIWDVSQPDPVLRLAGDHPGRDGAQGTAQPRLARPRAAITSTRSTRWSRSSSSSATR